MAELRLGVFGGTFNPIHIGHLLLAESFRARLGLDRVLLVPAGEPPHKGAQGLASRHHRYAMASLAVAGHPAFSVCDVDVRRPGPSYSVETVETVAAEWPRARLYFLMGSDTFLELLTWRTPERLTLWSTLAVGYRPASEFDADGPAARTVLRQLGMAGWTRLGRALPAELEAVAPGSVLLVDAMCLPISARDLRHRVAAGESIRYLVPLPVADYVAQHRLYVEPE